MDASREVWYVNGNEITGFIKSEEFHEQLRACWLVKRNSNG
jgi:hypothetical protein